MTFAPRFRATCLLAFCLLFAAVWRARGRSKVHTSRPPLFGRPASELFAVIAEYFFFRDLLSPDFNQFPLLVTFLRSLTVPPAPSALRGTKVALTVSQLLVRRSPRVAHSWVSLVSAVPLDTSSKHQLSPVRRRS